MKKTTISSRPAAPATTPRPANILRAEGFELIHPTTGDVRARLGFDRAGDPELAILDREGRRRLVGKVWHNPETGCSTAALQLSGESEDPVLELEAEEQEDQASIRFGSRGVPFAIGVDGQAVTMRSDAGALEALAGQLVGLVTSSPKDARLEAFGEIRARQLTIVDEQGRVRAELGTKSIGGKDGEFTVLCLYDATGEKLACIEADDGIGGALELASADPEGSLLEMFARGRESRIEAALVQARRMEALDREGRPRARLEADEDSSGFYLLDRGGLLQVALDVTADAGRESGELAFYSADEARINFGMDLSGTPYLRFSDQKGRLLHEVLTELEAAGQQGRKGAESQPLPQPELLALLREQNAMLSASLQSRDALVHELLGLLRERGARPSSGQEEAELGRATRAAASDANGATVADLLESEMPVSR